MFIKNDYDFAELMDACWSGAKDTLLRVYNNNAEEELMGLLEEVFYDETPTMTEVNDFLWFEAEEILEDRGCFDDEEENDDDEEEDDE